MKKIFIILIVLSLSFTSVFPQPANYTGWYYLNPLPTPGGLSEVRFINSNTGFALGNNLLIKTTNGGTNWYLDYSLINQFQQAPGWPVDLNSVSFSDNNTCYMTGAHFLMKSTNLGANWFNVEQVTAGFDGKFFNSQTGYITGTVDNRHISKTSDGGSNWYSIPVTGDYFNSSFFINPNTGYAVGWATGAIGIILKTTNGGTNWLRDTIGDNNFYGVQFTSVDTGYICGVNKVYKTTNEGQNWSIVHSGNWEQFRCLYFLNNNTGYIGNNGLTSKLYKTTNGGIDWQVCLINEAGFSSIYFITNETGYVTAGEVLKTTNAGATWVSQKHDFTNSSSYFQTIEFINQNTGFAGDDVGQIFKTTNAGNNWIKVKDTAGTLHPRIEDIKFVNDLTGYASGDYQTILKTTNCGINWLALSSGITTPDYTFYSMHFSDATTGFMTGTMMFSNRDLKLKSKREALASEQGHIILKTTNGGANWSVKDSTSAPYTILYTITFSNANTGYATGSSRIYKTTNSGENWAISTNLQSECSSCYLCKIIFINQSTGFIGGYSDNLVRIYKTTNGGDNWIKYAGNNFGSGGIYSMEFVNENTGYACGMSGCLIKTTNCGTNWFFLQSNFLGDIADVSFTSENTGYAVGLAGLVLKTTTGGGNPIGISPVSNSVPEKYYLQQNYPNPFNPTTKIRFSIPTPLSFGDGWRTSGALGVRLVVYDILGREVAELLNESLKPGEYEVEWDGSMYASGVYFYQLVSRDPSTGSGHSFVQTRKMVLMK